jgi:prophage endopeptidase
LSAYAIPLLVLLALAGVFHYDSVIEHRDRLEISLGEEQRETRRLTSELETERLAYAQRDRDDNKTRGDLDEALTEIDQLRRDVSAGAKRLRINATCPYRELPATTATPGVADGETVRLTTDAEQDYYTLVSEIEADQAKIKGLQRYIASQCSRDVTGSP